MTVGAMQVWLAFALCAIVAVAESTPEDEPIPFSEGRGQIFGTSDELIQSYRQQTPRTSELPAVIPADRLHDRFPPLEEFTNPESSLYVHLEPTPDSTPRPNPVPTRPDASLETTKSEGLDSTNLGLSLLNDHTAMTAAWEHPDTPWGLPSAFFSETEPTRPDFNRSWHLHVDLTVPRSEDTEAYDVEWHAESQTARTVVENSTTIYLTPLPDGHVQFFQIKMNGVVRRCELSPPLSPTSRAVAAFPRLPDMGDYHFAGYMAEEGHPQVEHWQHVEVGGPGELGAAKGESLNITHDMFILRDGADAVPLRYTLVGHSSVPGRESDTFTHRYRLLPAPTGPILPDPTQECDVDLTEQSGTEDKERQRRYARTVW